MMFSKSFKVACCFSLSVVMTNIPALAVAESSMIPTSVVVDHLDRSQTETKIHDFLSRTDVQKALLEQGVSPDEISSRVASLSETELRQLLGQVEHAQAGGDILVTVLLVVLIIFLVKRI